MDLVIKSVPDGAEEKVKEMAMVAIERFIKERDVKVAEEVEDKFKTDIDTIRESNGLTGKYEELVSLKEEYGNKKKN
jgi:hypothetical protein